MANTYIITEYSYDLRGNIQQLKYNDKVLSVNEYDNFNHLIKSTDNMGNSEYYAYDELGNLIRYKDKNLNVTINEYDNMYRLTQTQIGNISVEYTYDSLGNVLTMTDSAGTTSYSYTYNNLLSGITTPDNKTISYFYDGAFNVNKMIDYDNNVYEYTYDQANRIDTITKNNQLIADYNYRGYGSENGIESIVYPEGTVYYTYDNAMRVTSQFNELFDGTNIAYYEYTYDIPGNMIEKKETVNGDDKITYYEYDDLNQLKKEIAHDGTITEYRHDIWDNIWAKITIPASDSQLLSMQDETNNTNDTLTCCTLYYYYNDLNQLISSEEYITDTDDVYGGTLNNTTEFTYDANGNMLSKAIYGQDDEDVVEYSYTYNQLNQLTEFEDAEGNVTSYAYDGTGMRISKTQGEDVQKFYWDRGYIINESLNGTFTASNSVGAQGVFERTTGSEENTQTNFLFKNAHGDVTDVISDDEILNEYDYDAYGNQKELSPADTNPFRYCGEYYDEESGLIYLRNRYYDPEIERFITEDPAMDGMNWYTYCSNNPVMFVDPWGLEEIVVSGSEYDDSERYKYNFIEPAIKKLRSLRSVNSSEEITWIVSSAGYTDSDIASFNELSQYLNVKFIAIDSRLELRNYINSKNTENSSISDDRRNDKIDKFIIFSHGLINSVELGYGQDNSRILSLNSMWISTVDSEAFENTISTFYSCNTGTGGGSSFAQKWVNVTGGWTFAVVDGQTSYTFMNVGESNADKLRRFLTGYNTAGSVNYPIAGNNSKGFQLFTR